MALSEERHFGRAASRLSVTQPTLSASIKQLETAAGAVLVERGAKTVALTAAGVSLLAEARSILEQSARTIQATQAAGQGLRGWLNVSFSGSMIYAGVPQYVASYRGRNPNIVTTLVEYSRFEQLHALTNGQMDAGFIDASSLPADFDGVVVCDDAFICCVSESHRLARRDEINLTELSEEQFVLFSREMAVESYDRIVSICLDAGFEPKIRNAARQWLSLAWVAEGLGVALVPERLARTKIAGVRFIPMNPPSPVRSHGYLIWNPKRLTPELELFIALVREQPAHI